MPTLESLSEAYRQNAALEMERAASETLPNVRIKHEKAAENWIAMAQGAERAMGRRR